MAESKQGTILKYEKSKIEGRNMEKAINNTLSILTQLQPPYTKMWSKFDNMIIELSKSECWSPIGSVVNIYDQIFAQLNLINRVAMSHRFNGRFEISLSTYDHLQSFAQSRGVSYTLFPKCFVFTSHNITVLYRDWSEKLEIRSNEYKSVLNKAIKQTYFTEKCIKCIEYKTTTKMRNKLLYQAYVKYFRNQSPNINIDLFKASMYYHRALLQHSVNVLSPELNKRILRQTELNWNKAFEIFMAPNIDFTEQTFYFIAAYVYWLFEMRNKIRLNRKMIDRLLKRNLHFAFEEFGELSEHIAHSYRAFGVYYGVHYINYRKSIKYFQKAIDALHKCIQKQSIDNIQFDKYEDDKNPLLLKIYHKLAQYNYELGQICELNGDLYSALEAYEQCMSDAMEGLLINVLDQIYVKKDILHLQIKAKDEINRIESYNHKTKENARCKNCQKCRKKQREMEHKQSSSEKARFLKSNSEKQDIILRNLANSKQCEFCHNKGRKLKKCSNCYSVYYCNKKCQKSNWKYHKIICQK
eukprot:498304_1